MGGEVGHDLDWVLGLGLDGGGVRGRRTVSSSSSEEECHHSRDMNGGMSMGTMAPEVPNPVCPSPREARVSREEDASMTVTSMMWGEVALPARDVWDNTLLSMSRFSQYATLTP